MTYGGQCWAMPIRKCEQNQLHTTEINILLRIRDLYNGNQENSTSEMLPCGIQQREKAHKYFPHEENIGMVRSRTAERL